MNENSTSRRPDALAADIAHFVERLYQSGLELLTGAAAGEQELALEELLERLQVAVQTLFDQCREQVRSLEIPHEAMLGAWAPLSALQASLERLPSGLGLPLGLPPGLLPRLGMLQYRQQQLEGASAALEELRAAQERYLQLLKQIADGAIEEFRAALQARQQQEMELKELYGLWLNAGEAAYERVLTGEPYAQALGQLANASSGVLHQFQEAVDDALELFNLPTRREMISTQQRLHEMRRGQRAGQRALDELREMREEMEDLRAEVERLRSARSSKKTAKRTAAPKPIDHAH